MNQNLMAKKVASLWVIGVVSVVRNSHLAYASPDSLGRGDWLDRAGDTPLRCPFLPCGKHTCLGTFWDICFQNSQKIWQNLKKNQILLVCLWKQQTKRFQGVLPHVLKTLGCILCGVGGTDGGLGWKQAVMSRLPWLSILPWSCWRAQGEHSGSCTRGPPWILLGRDGWPDLCECPAGNRLGLQKHAPQGKAATLVFAGIQNTWKGGKKRKFCQRWGSRAPAAQWCAAALLARPNHPSTWTLVWAAGSPSLHPPACTWEPAGAALLGN